MKRFIAGRLLATIPVMGVVATLVFLLLRLAPGDPAAILAGDIATPEQIAAIRARLGLDQPIWTQYVHYLGRVAHGDLGTSFRTGDKVSTAIKERYPATIELALGAMFVALLVAFPLGMISAI